MNSRLDTIQAAILIEKLNVLEGEIATRAKIAAGYSQLLGKDFHVPMLNDGQVSAWAQYTVRPKTGNRSDYQEALAANGIPSAIYYQKSLHLQTAYAELGIAVGSLPVAERLSGEVFSLPMHPYMASDQVEKIATALLG